MRAAKCHLIRTRESQSPAMNRLETFAQHFADAVWGTPLVILLLGGGLFFLILSRATPYRRFGHGIAVLLGRYDTPDAAGEISHKQALAAALSNTCLLYTSPSPRDLS